MNMPIFLTLTLIAMSLAQVACTHDGEVESLDPIKEATRQQHPKVSHVTPAQVADWLQTESGERRLILLDVRESREHEVSHLKGAVRISPDAEAEDLIEGALQGVAKDRRIVLYCSVGVRSAAVTSRLKEAGFSDVHNMNGSIFQWANEGRPVYRGEAEARKVHPYNARWGHYLKAELRGDP